MTCVFKLNIYTLFRLFFLSHFFQQTLNGKVKNLERQKKVLLQKLEQNPIDQQQEMQSELNDTNNKLKEVNQKLAVSMEIDHQCHFYKATYVNMPGKRLGRII